MSTPENHQRFLRHLGDSTDAVWKVARWLHARGHHVKVNAAGRAERHDQWREYTDEGDLEISLRVEVKCLGCMFTSAADWPFKDKFIVCAVHAWERAIPKPYGFIYLNNQKTHAACVMGATRDTWTIETRYDQRYEDIKQDFFFAPMTAVIFFNLGNYATL